MFNSLLVSTIVLVSWSYKCEGFRSDIMTGVNSFNNIIVTKLRSQLPVILDGTNFRLVMQRYKKPFGTPCTLKVKVYDKKFKRQVDTAKMPCGIEKDKGEDNGILHVGDLIYSKEPSALVFMMKGGGCVVRNYFKDGSNVEMYMDRHFEDWCRQYIEGDGGAVNTEGK